MTRKEAIKILQDYPNCTIGQLSEVPVKAVLEFMETIPHWISVEDELPPRAENSFILSDYVLVCDNIGYMETACYNFEKNRWDWMNNVTHWMPIVPPRKEDHDRQVP